MKKSLPEWLIGYEQYDGREFHWLDATAGTGNRWGKTRISA